jgi:hypothetical protein
MTGRAGALILCQEKRVLTDGAKQRGHFLSFMCIVNDTVVEEKNIAVDL